MKRRGFLYFAAAVLVVTMSAASCTETKVVPPSQYLVMSCPTYNDSAIVDVATRFGPYDGNGGLAVGAGMIVSYLSQDPDIVETRLRNFLAMAEKQNMPVVIELDGINYWQAHPELWNWWDPDKPGYDPDNRNNVEWSDWTPDAAVKIGWRNWGSQHRVLPMPNLSSPEYREACFTQLKRLVPVILDWWNALPEDKKYLLVGVQVGVEVSIGANNWYYPDGNSYLSRPVEDDPTYGLDHSTLPDRGSGQSIGYAAVKTLGIADSGELTEWDVVRATDDYATTLCKFVSDLGIPRDRLFMHGGGWKEGESLYWVAMNPYSCPNWSFYTHAKDPREETSAMAVLRKSEAPWWGIGEWLIFDEDPEEWTASLDTVLSLPKLRYVQIRHWGSIEDKPEIVSAVKGLVDKY